MIPLLPERSRLAELSGIGKVEELVWDSLLRPLEAFLARPGKNLRGKLVELAGRLSCPEGAEVTESVSRSFAVASRIVEALHAGALIIDDIEDGSSVRRDGPTFHLKHGVPVALNAGNWLYFWALHQIGALGLDAERERELTRACHAILLEAHFGQALDVGVRIDELPQDRVFDACLTAVELKTGALAALSMRLGGAASGAPPERLATLDRVGRRFGTALQLFEDLGNFCVNSHGTGYSMAKRHEDLYLRRPSWIWAVAARHTEPREYARFVEAVRRLPDESFLKPWVELNDFTAKARREASLYLDTVRAEIRAEFGESHPAATAELMSLMDLLEKVYG